MKTPDIIYPPKLREFTSHVYSITIQNTITAPLFWNIFDRRTIRFQIVKNYSNPINDFDIQLK